MRSMIALFPLLLAACTGQSLAPQSAEITPAPQPLYVRHIMQAEVNPAIVAIWDVSNNAYNDAGELDPALITDGQWASLTQQAEELALISDRMAAASTIRAASAGNMATGEYEVPMDNVQSFIDADPQGFRDMSADFAVLSRNLAAAGVAQDLPAAANLVGQMDGECASCHERYWYAEAE